MKRWLLNLAAALSLTLLVATAALWVRSRFVIDSYLTWYADGTERVLTSARGQVVLRKIWLKYPSAPTAEFRSARLTEGYTTRTGFAGFFVEDGKATPAIPNTPNRWVIIAIPYWSIALTGAALPAIVLRRRLGARRQRSGTCAACGYDLRATPGRCPECGTAANVKAIIAA